MRLKDKHILLGIGGSISAYKAADLVRLLQKQGADVQVMMSDTACHFITPLTLEVLSGRPVLRNAFQSGEAIPHIRASRKADLVVVAPATANQLAKFAYGMADDLISATLLAAKCPVLIAPAMNVEMWNNALVQQNVSKLRDAGYEMVGPGEGELACGEYGEGRLIDLQLLLDEIIKLLLPQDLQGKKVMVTAGPTREYADPVRFLSNGSTGKMGFALAREAYYRGADVTLVAGIVNADMPVSIKKVPAVTAAEMQREVLKRAPYCDIFVGNAAVSDYRFASYSPRKIKKGRSTMEMALEKNEDILEKLSRKKKRPFLVGFALETEDHFFNARQKFCSKALNMLVVNDVSALGSDEAEVTVFIKKHRAKPFKLPRLSKDMVARNIFDIIVKSL